MATGDIKLVYGTAADVTITLNALAASPMLVAGQESTAIDNTTALALDYLVSGKVVTHATITAGGRIEVWAVASWDGATYPDVFDGTDSVETITNLNIKNTICRLVASMAVDVTGTYHFAGVSIASIFGGTVPPKFVFFVTHNTHATNTLEASTTHKIRVQPVYENVAA